MSRTFSRFGTTRRGVVLVFFAILLVGLLGVVALVVDLGFATLTRRQMQAGVNTAALEVLRYRDDLPPDHVLTGLVDNPGDYDPQDSAHRHMVRRLAARRIVADLFDDNLQADADDARNFGAGPVVNVVDRIITLPQPPVYDPLLALNEANDIAGDIVVGAHIPSATPGENASYGRPDFTPSATLAESDEADSSLVRLRRSGETMDPDVGQAGPPVPSLWSRGVLLRAESTFDGNPVSEDALHIRHERGTIVRATAVASAAVVQCAGPPQVDETIPALAPLALSQTFWESVNSPFSIDASLFGPVPFDVAGSPNAGRSFDPQATLTTGETLILAAPTNPLPAVNVVRYFPIVRDDDSVVLGFGLARIVPQGGTLFTVTPVVTGAPLATSNAIAHFRSTAHLTSSLLDELNVAQQSPTLKPRLLHAPALVRSIP